MYPTQKHFFLDRGALKATSYQLRYLAFGLLALGLGAFASLAAESPTPFPSDPDQQLEHTCFQTAAPWSEVGNLRSDVAIVYGIDPGLPSRLQTWRDRGYRMHLMTGVSWGNYIAQVWTGTARTPNVFRGELRERTFEAAFLEYGAMQNLVRATGRRVWYLNDPVEDNPNHDWEDYRLNWESTLVASLFQPEIWHYEVAPWPERVFGGTYPRKGKPAEREPIPPAYATELQTVMNALNDMNQSRVEWDCGTMGLGVLVSDSLMFQRGDPMPSDQHLSQVYGLALPLLKRGMPVTPIQLENLTVTNYLEGFRLLLLSYHGQKPLSPDVHAPLAAWVKRGGALVVMDDDTDSYNRVREWWNSDGRGYATPREHLFEQLGLTGKNALAEGEFAKFGKGGVLWLRENPAKFVASADGDARLVQSAMQAAARVWLKWRETNYLLLRRGPYLIAAGLDESVPGQAKELRGRFVNLFDPLLRVRNTVKLTPSSRSLLLDLNSVRGNEPRVLASACKALPKTRSATQLVQTVEGVGNTPAILLLHAPKPPREVTLAGQAVTGFEYSVAEKLLWIRFPNKARPRELAVQF